jgi:hypothetical protein
VGHCIEAASALDKYFFALPHAKGQMIALSATTTCSALDVIIFFPLYSEFSCSGDFLGKFSQAPLKYVSYSQPAVRVFFKQPAFR